MNVVRKVFTPKVRAAIYGLLGLVHVFAVFYHLVEDEEWALWESTILGAFDIAVSALAFSNTPGVTDKVKEDQ